MNKILITNNILKDFDDGNITIKDNNISFKTDNEYVLEYIDSNNININIEVNRNTNIKLFIYAKDNDLKITNNIILNEESNLLLFKFYANNKTEENIKVDLNGRLATFNCGFSSISKDNDKYNIIINHNCYKTISNINNHVVTLNNAKNIFNIDSNVYKDSSNCKLNQATKIITFGDSLSEIHPNMYIDRYDVEAKHSSVVGKFSDEEIFYLESRGIEYNDAIKLLVKGFLLGNIKANMEQRANILNIINNNWR